MPRSFGFLKKRWVRRVKAHLANPYLKVGAALLCLALLGMLVLVNLVIMPSYTRSDAAFAMPNVEGIHGAEALDTLAAYHFGQPRLDTVLEYSVARGTVLAQRPLPGAQVKPGRTVYLKVSDNTRDTVRVPNVINELESVALNTLRSRGLIPGARLPDPKPSPYAGFVTRQRPAADSLVLRFDTVDVWIGQGPGVRLVEIPDLAGLPIQAARRQLEAIGLYTVFSRHLSRKEVSAEVERQSPSPGEVVRVGQEVLLFVAEPDSL